MTNSEIVMRARDAGLHAFIDEQGAHIWIEERPLGKLEVEALIDVPFECMAYFPYGVIAYGVDA